MKNSWSTVVVANCPSISTRTSWRITSSGKGDAGPGRGGRGTTMKPSACRARGNEHQRRNEPGAKERSACFHLPLHGRGRLFGEIEIFRRRLLAQGADDGFVQGPGSGLVLQFGAHETLTLGMQARRSFSAARRAFPCMAVDVSACAPSGSCPSSPGQVSLRHFLQLDRARFFASTRSQEELLYCGAALAAIRWTAISWLTEAAFRSCSSWRVLPLPPSRP